MNLNAMAMVFGVVFLLVGLAGFFPAPPPPNAPPLAVPHGHGMLFGLFPVNTLHNFVHLLFGALGIAAWAGVLMTARGYFQLVAISYVVLAVLGLFPGTHTLFGLAPIWGNDIWLHALLAIVAAYFGYVAPAPVPITRRA